MFHNRIHVLSKTDAKVTPDEASLSAKTGLLHVQILLSMRNERGHGMSVLVSGAGTVSMPLPVQHPTVGDMHAVCRKKSADAIFRKDAGLTWDGAGKHPEQQSDMQVPADVLLPFMALQDILSCRKMRVDYINGALVTSGQRHSIPLPYNNSIMIIIEFRKSIAVEGGGH
jgi:hypothetical protein